MTTNQIKLINRVVSRHVPIRASNREAIRITLNQAQGSTKAFLNMSVDYRKDLMRTIIKAHAMNRIDHRRCMNLWGK